MEFKRIVVLANSIKRNQRCVAGIELFRRNEPGSAWVRPISGESQGELEPRHMRIEGDSPLALLDVVDVPLASYGDDPIHPEDWIIDETRPWKRAGILHPVAVDGLQEQPDDLWLEFADRADRSRGEFLLRKADHQSLYLIRPTDLRVELSMEHNGFKNKDQKKTRAKFIYREQEYQMSITDPIFTDCYCTGVPALGAKPLVVRPPFGDACLLCVSLTREFNGYHYKVVAAVLELP
jgi:hypothetical protein